MSFGLGREWYVIDIGDDASDAPTKRLAIARAKAHVKGGPHGSGVWTGLDMHEITVPAAMVYRSDERIQPDEREYVFAIWRGTDKPTIDESSPEIHESRDPEVVKEIQRLINPPRKANPVLPEEVGQASKVAKFSGKALVVSAAAVPVSYVLGRTMDGWTPRNPKQWFVDNTDIAVVVGKSVAIMALALGGLGMTAAALVGIRDGSSRRNEK